MLTEDEILKINQEYKYDVRVFSDKILVNSKWGNWVAQEIAENLYILKHINSNCSKHRYHVQRKGDRGSFKYASVEEVFKNIKEHDEYYLFGETK